MARHDATIMLTCMHRMTLTAGLVAVIALTLAGAANASVGTTIDPSSTRDYWTPERIRAADARAGYAMAASGPRRRGRRWDSFPAAAKLVDTDTIGVRTIGRLYSVGPDGSPYVCSAALVASANASVVWTAGHCLHTGRGGAYRTQLAFVPGARAGATPQDQAPYGVWPAVRAATTTSWARSGDRSHFRRDFGAVVIGRDAAGRTITDVLGGAHRLAFSKKRPRRFTAFGYPGLGRFAGNMALWKCPRRGVGAYRWIRGTGPQVQIARCEMNAGSSGGPWVTRIGRDGLGTVVSVTSAGLGDDGTKYGNTIYGPVQERVARRLFKQMQRVPV